MKLESKHLAPYEKGVSGVKIKLNENGLRNLWDIDEDTRFLQGKFTISFIDYENNTLQIRSAEDERYTYEEIELGWIELILRPLSDLKKDENNDMFELNLQLCDILNSPNCEHFIKAIIDKKYYAVDFQLFNTLSEFLDKNHFDWRFNLIDQDLAIDINTIEL